MTVGPAHTYIKDGLSKGLSLQLLEKVVDEAKDVSSSGYPPIYSLKHLSHYTGINYVYLRFVIRRNHAPYETYRIRKRSGGFRFISEPEDRLKTLQRWITTKILYHAKPHWRCFSFHKNSSIKKCAAEHCDSRWLIKIDIERFFESVSEFKVYKVYREMGYKPLVAFELTRLCTIQPKHMLGKKAKDWILYNKPENDLPYDRRSPKYIGRLPQGAPTSPQLSNLAFRELDEVFENIAAKNCFTYTRYADDIAFSTRRNSFNRKNALAFVREINTILLKAGYNPQHKKLKIIPPGAKKIVLGLDVTSSMPRLLKSYKKKIEVHLRGIEVFGVTAHTEHRKFNSISSMLDHVRGLINYATLIEPDYAKSLEVKFNKLVESSGLKW